jgi:hypothetical protein
MKMIIYYESIVNIAYIPVAERKYMKVKGCDITHLFSYLLQWCHTVIALFGCQTTEQRRNRSMPYKNR